MLPGSPGRWRVLYGAGRRLVILHHGIPSGVCDVVTVAVGVAVAVSVAVAVAERVTVDVGVSVVVSVGDAVALPSACRWPTALMSW